MADAKDIGEQAPQQDERAPIGVGSHGHGDSKINNGVDTKESPYKFGNNFGALRLLFAYLVILSHSPEILDGNRSREILTRLFGTLSFGELAVNSFFIISGYLVTKSFVNSHSALDYLLKRALRIYPGYVVAFLLCFLVIGPAVGGKIESPLALSLIKLVKHLLFLQTPDMKGVFDGSYYPALNGSMWTLSYEFRCYLVVMALGVSGLLLKRRTILLSTAGLLVLTAAVHISGFDQTSFSIGNMIRLSSAFGCGALFYLYQDKVRYSGKYAFLAALSLLPLMFSRALAEVAFATLGAYLIFCFAFNVKSEKIARIGQRADLSYGVYLYAWPVQKLVVLSIPGISPWILASLTGSIVAPLALVSWFLVEKPALELKQIISRRKKVT